jgi:hypothetical protein
VLRVIPLTVTFAGLADTASKLQTRTSALGSRITAVRGNLKRVQEKCSRSLVSFDFDERKFLLCARVFVCVRVFVCACACVRVRA